MGFFLSLYTFPTSFNPLSLPCILSFLSSRDQNEVLTEDREKLRVLQPLQPWFSQEQREELAEVHPWIQQHTIPQEIDTQVGILNHTNTPQTYLSFYSTWHRFKCIFFLSHRVVWAAAQPQGLPTLLSLLLLTARVLWSALSRTPLDLWLTLERLWSQKNQPPSSQKTSRARNLVNSYHAFLLTNVKETGPCALVWSWTFFVKVSVAGPGHEEHRNQEQWAFLQSVRFSKWAYCDCLYRTINIIPLHFLFLETPVGV